MWVNDKPIVEQHHRGQDSSSIQAFLSLLLIKVALTTARIIYTEIFSIHSYVFISIIIIVPIAVRVVEYKLLHVKGFIKFMKNNHY